MLWALMIITLERGYPYWITVVLAVLAGGVLVRVFILFHDCYDEVPAIQAVKSITLKASISSLRLSLYDEENQKLVGFSRLQTMEH
jgi:hypothetical protein